MASSLATHQFAGVNAQLKCVPRPLSDANTGSTPLARRTDVSRSAKSAMIRPPRERRARARRDARVGSDAPGLTTIPSTVSPGPPPRARTSRPRATSRCVPGSCAFFGDIWRRAGSRNEENETPAPRRMWLAFEPCARASRRARGGHPPGVTARAFVAFPERSDARSPSPAPPPVGSNAPSRRRRATRTSGASAVFESRTRLVGALCHCSPCGVFLFLCRKPKTTIDRSTTRTGPRRSPTRPPPFPSTTPRDTKRPALWAMLPTPPRRLSP